MEKIKIKYKETKQLRNTSIEALEFETERYRNSLRRGGYNTIGDILDHWNDMQEYAKSFGKRSGTNPAMGVTVVRNVKASVFAYMCSMGLVEMKQVVEA